MARRIVRLLAIVSLLAGAAPPAAVLADAPLPARETGQRSGPVAPGTWRVTVVRFVAVTSFGHNATCPRRQAGVGNLTSMAGTSQWYSDTAHVHAVTAAGGSSYTYDANGNMLTRPDQTLAWDAENRLASVTQGGVTTAFTYNGDGQRVKVSVGNVITAYVGSLYEVNPSSGVTTTYYFLGSQHVAMRTSAGVTYLAGDHLGSASLATNSAACPGRG